MPSSGEIGRIVHGFGRIGLTPKSCLNLIYKAACTARRRGPGVSQATAIWRKRNLIPHGWHDGERPLRALDGYTAWQDALQMADLLARTAIRPASLACAHFTMK